MHGSSGDTQFTFNDNPVAPAEEASQTSPGTADSGSKSTISRSTLQGWNMTGQRRRAATSTPRSARDGTRQAGNRSPRRSTTRPGTPRSLEDRPGRTKGEGRVKRRTTETSGSRAIENQKFELQSVAGAVETAASSPANARFLGPMSCKNLTGGRLHFQNYANTTEMLGFVSKLLQGP